MLQAKGLWFRYGHGRPWVLRDLDLHVAAGEVVGLSGPSGCGKSTVGRLLAGFAEPDRGHVTVDGARPGSPRSAHPVQLVLQQPEAAMDPRWSVRRTLAATGAPAADLEAVDPRLLQPDWLDRRPHELSGGQLQRINLARALLARPAYMVADEITASLDAITQVRLWDLLLEHCRRDGIGVLAIAHDRPLLEAVASRVLDWQASSPDLQLPPGGA